MKLNLAKELAALERMTVGELHERYAEVFGETARSRHKQYLIRRIAWRLADWHHMAPQSGRCCPLRFATTGVTSGVPAPIRRGARVA
jgi:hypothetical protein